eukprot:scaffold140147_cov17-Tisochrysis_lutea.AAC.1
MEGGTGRAGVGFSTGDKQCSHSVIDLFLSSNTPPPSVAFGPWPVHEGVGGRALSMCQYSKQSSRLPC